ncbi:MAG: hypothetical protein HY064_10530 [Bacteroidetes bacterium]|nr:hypothetical protein [Bacteroidota bacterium]
MKKIFLFLFILAPAFLFSQKKKDGNNFHWISEQWAVAPSGGQFHPDLRAMNNQLTAWKGNDQDLFYSGLRGYGLTYAGPCDLTRGGEFDGSFAFDLMMPSKVSIGKVQKDSLTFDLKGWNFMSSFFGKDIIPGSIVALVLAPGIDWGTLKMISAVNGNGTLQRNFFIAPLGRAEMRFVFGPICLGARGCYRYDVTKDSWNLKSGPAFALPGVKNTGTSIEFFVGWGHVHYQ